MMQILIPMHVVSTDVFADADTDAAAGTDVDRSISYIREKQIKQFGSLKWKFYWFGHFS